MTRNLMLGAMALVWAGCDAGEEPAVALAANPASELSADAAIITPGACRIIGEATPLPAAVRETSGLARSRRDPNLFWTHNDAGNDPVLFALDGSGALAGQVRVQGSSLEDWEDIESGACESGNCLFVGDIGDNDAVREEITIYRIAEPAAGATESESAAPLKARFPDGPQDAEALFVLPSGDIFIVTKGRTGPIVLYRYPSPQHPGETVTLERVRELAPQPEGRPDWVTGANASPNGRWVGIRTYRTLRFYPSASLVGGGPLNPVNVDLEPFGESQGEALVLADDGAVWLTSEAENKDDLPRWTRLQCTLPAAESGGGTTGVN